MYHNISTSIAAFKGDCIVNSLGEGMDIDYPGQLYRSILLSTKNREALHKEVKEKGTTLPFCSVFMTDSYGLPSKKIIHVITPFRRNDKDHSKIADCYKKVLQLALDSGFKSISVPLIGTGANGYSSDKVASIARRICYKFALEHPEIEVYFNIYTVEHDLDEEDMPHPCMKKSTYPDGTAPKRRQGTRENQSFICADMYAPEPWEPKETRPSFLEEIGIEDEDSFATLVRKCVFSRAKGKKEEKEAALEDTWLEINSLVGEFKGEVKKDDAASLEYTVNALHKSKEEGKPVDKSLLVNGKFSHSPEYEWKKVKNTKGKGYVWQRPNKAEILLCSVALHLRPEEVMEVYEFCGFSLSKYERHERAFRECVALIRSRDPWTNILKAYRFATSESIYDYKEDRKKIYVDRDEKWK